MAPNRRASERSLSPYSHFPECREITFRGDQQVWVMCRCVANERHHSCSCLRSPSRVRYPQATEGIGGTKHTRGIGSAVRLEGNAPDYADIRPRPCCFHPCYPLAPLAYRTRLDPLDEVGAVSALHHDLFRVGGTISSAWARIGGRVHAEPCSTRRDRMSAVMLATPGTC